MSPNFVHSLCASALAAVVISAPGAAQTSRPSTGPVDAPAKFFLTPDGSFRRYHNSIVTSIWSGYAVTAGPYSSASGTWQVPSVSYDGAPNPPYNEEAADNWVGIGGDGDSTLIQLGTSGTVFTDGTTSYGAWY